MIELHAYCLDALYLYEATVVLFFFQAEDGIRDRSPSRGLGDVYKRQVQHHATTKNIDTQNLETVVKRRIEFYF